MPQTTILVFCDKSAKIPLLDWLNELEQAEPQAYVKCLARIQQLERYGYEMRRPAADLLRDGLYELRAKLGRVHYRMLYFFCGKNIACLFNGFTKEGVIPDIEIKRALTAKKLVERDRNRYTAEWEL